MEIDVFSDPICPWCFIGKRRLSKALEMRPDNQVRVKWRAFQLNPEMPHEGMNRAAYLQAKFGGEDNAARVYDNIAAVGKSVGIDFRFDLIQRTPNTLDAHRLIRYFQATNHPDTNAFVTRLFEAYFLEGLDIGDVSTLVQLAGSFDVTKAEVLDLLASDQFRQEVVDEDVLARRIGINGVPCFIVDGQYALSGAQEPEAFMPLFDLAVSGTTASTALS
ncbi:DsbA family oxidoreductase [Aestuariispira ectoiniformans]|uniref:DsbA family oxidoreductase n=1 Tax=Aestuariispira ectoiniformans TaxID=2775080 RepID=UPI00223B0CD8|nr:DsbA family oxidoreductase [Aestuariispira ectoiniformans]